MPRRLGGAEGTYDSRGRWGPQLPPLKTARAMGSKQPHDPIGTAAEPVTHVHQHADYGQGTPAPPGQKLGIHIHAHTHRGDGAHHAGRGDHQHGVTASPGNPDPSMPHIPLNENNEKSGLPGGETRDGGLEDIDLGAAFTAYFKAEEKRTGVPLSRELEWQETARQTGKQRTRNRREAMIGAAISLRNAKDALRSEQEGFIARHAGCNIGLVAEAAERAEMAKAQLHEVCLDDPELIAWAKRRAAR